MKFDVRIFSNGWISPITRKGLDVCGAGVKLETVNAARRWCTAMGLNFAK